MKAIKKFLNSLEDPSYPFLGPTIKGLKFSGLLLSGSLLRRSIYFFLHLSVIVLGITEFIDIWFVKNDIQLLLANLKITLLTTINVFKVLTFLIWQKRWKRILKYVTKANIEQLESSDEINLSIVAKTTKYCRSFTYIFWILTYITGAAIILQPIMKYALTPSHREHIRTGEEQYLQVISSYVPFDKTKMPGYLVAFVYQASGTIYAAGWVASFDSNAMVIMVFIYMEIQVLRRDSANMFGSPESPVSREEVQRRLKKFHNRHVDMVKYAKLFNSCLSPIMLLYALVCSIMLCVTSFQMSYEKSFAQRCILAELIVFGVSQLFLYCWLSNTVLYASQDLSLGPYESAWWSNKSHRKDVLVLIMQYRKTIVFSAGPFTDLTLPTFLNIIKGAYSYYTLLSSSNEET